MNSIDKSSKANADMQYRMFLFHKILLCCKEIGTGKKGKLGGRAPPPPTRNGKPRLALKGRIFMANVTETVIMKQSGKSALKIGSDMKVRNITDSMNNSWRSLMSDFLAWRRKHRILHHPLSIGRGNEEMDSTD